jgi:hypothetical protein
MGENIFTALKRFPGSARFVLLVEASLREGKGFGSGKYKAFDVALV